MEVSLTSQILGMVPSAHRAHLNLVDFFTKSAQRLTGFCLVLKQKQTDIIGVFSMSLPKKSQLLIVKSGRPKCFMILLLVQAPVERCEYPNTPLKKST